MGNLSELQSRISRISNPRVAYSVNGYQAWDKVTQKEFSRNLKSYDQIVVNTSSVKNAIMFDVDNPGQYIPPEITPYTSTFNKFNDKQHPMWLLEKPIYTSSIKQKEWYRDNIQAPLTKIAFIAGTDHNYKNTTTKNPFNTEDFRVNTHGNILKSVFDLISLYNADINTLSVTEKTIKKDGRYLSERYKKALGILIEHSMINTKLIFSDKDQFIKIMYLKASMLKDEISSLKEYEVMAICEDVINYQLEWGKALSKIQSIRAKNALAKRWGNTVEVNKINLTRAIIDLSAKQIKPTYKNLALSVNLSEITLKKYYNTYIKQEKIRLKQ